MILIARNRLVITGRIQQLVEEVFHMRRILLTHGLPFGYANQLQESQPIRISVSAALSDGVPVVVAKRLGILRAEVTQMAEAIVTVDDELDGRRTAGARNPDRRMGLL